MQGAQQRKMHDVLDLVSASQVLQPEAIMKMLSPEVGISCMPVVIHQCSTPHCKADIPWSVLATRSISSSGAVWFTV